MRTLALALLLPLAASAGTTVNVSSMNVNGMDMRDIVCDLTSGGLFASMAVASELANQKEAFDACHPAGAAVSMSWTWRNGATHDVSVVSSSHEPANACMIAALGAIQSPQSGTCTATLLIGDANAAAAALTPVQTTPAAPSTSSTPSPKGDGEPVK